MFTPPGNPLILADKRYLFPYRCVIHHYPEVWAISESASLLAKWARAYAGVVIQVMAQANCPPVTALSGIVIRSSGRVAKISEREATSPRFSGY
jgi:hypothetical protein